MSSDATDLAQLIQRRELTAYEQRMARVAYAYGVDLRRSHWLDDSTLGEPIMRTVDRRWGALVADLAENVFDSPGVLPPWLLEDLAAAASLLRAPLPTVRTIRASARATTPWPAVTPLGTTKGAMKWLVLDLPAVAAMDPPMRRFILAASVAHLQCEHGPLFTAHLMARDSRWTLTATRRLVAPWTKVAVFSADRAGLLATTDLDAALRGIRGQLPTANVPWWPRFPGLEAREEALRDFERSAVVARTRRLRDAAQPVTAEAPDQEASDDEPTEATADKSADVKARPWSLTRCDERLTRRLGLF